MFQDPVGLSNKLSCEAGSFSSHCNSHRFLQPQVLRHYFPVPGLPGLSCSPVVPPSLSACKCGTTQSSSHHLTASPLLPGCLSLPRLLVWMNVSSLTPLLSDFHTVRFSDSFGCFLFLNLSLSLFGCVRRHSVFTYGHILARSPQIFHLLIRLIFSGWHFIQGMSVHKSTQKK